MPTKSPIPIAENAPATDTSTIALGAAARSIADVLMSKDEFAELTNRSPRTIDRWIRNRTAPPHIPVGSGVKFHVDAVAEWLKRREIRIDTKRGRRA